MLSANPGLEDQVRSARFWMLMERAPLWVLTSGLLAAVVAWGIRDMVPTAPLVIWLLCKWLTLLPRLLHALWLSKHEDMPPHLLWRRHYPIELAALLLDGFVWGALAWALCPLEHIYLGAITLSTLLGVAAIRMISLAIDIKALLAFILPMLLPNLLYVSTRQDALGSAVTISLASFVVCNVIGGFQIQRRSKAMLRLRFNSDRIADELSQALEQARIHSEAKTRFLATVSHEMRTPLHGILGLTRVLMQEHPRADQHQRLMLIERSGDHLLTVINDILDFSKIESGRMTLDVRPFDLGSLLADVVSVFQVLAQRKGLALSCHTPWQGVCEVRGDAGRVRQIMHNLLGNAVKFTDSGHIHLEVSCSHEAMYSFTVQDTGPGIAPEQMSFIFEPFTQAPHPKDHHHGGTGLGLSIAREMCRSMGGDLVCDSLLGKGATFKATMCLQPQSSEMVPGKPVAVAAAAAHGHWMDTAPFEDSDLKQLTPSDWQTAAGTTILLVEDNPVNVVLAEAMLRNLGCTVHTVTDGQQALDWLADQYCDVVLMDCTMPVMDGFEATRRIRQREQAEQRSRVPIVAISASTMADERNTCIQAGMDVHLAKPFTPDDLHTVIGRAINNAPLFRAF